MQNSIYEQDFLIRELPQPVKNLLDAANLPWLNSLEFCTGYDPNPAAERVWLRMDAEKIHQAAFYCIEKRYGFFRVIQIIGFPDIEEKDIKRLIKTHQAQLAVVNRLEKKPVQHDEKWQPVQANAYFKTCITISTLPSSKDEFLKQLGKNKREQLPRFWRRLVNHCNNALEVRYESKTEIKLDDVVQLECLNRERRASKDNGVNSISEIQQRQKQLFPLTQDFGFLVTLRHEGKILGGTFCYIYGKGAYNVLTGHDPALDNIRVGALGTWKTMEYMIDKGIVEYNFLWGRQKYKTQFLGLEYPWVIHVISPYQGLAILWKYQINFNEFYIRVRRFLKTKMGFILRGEGNYFVK